MLDNDFQEIDSSPLATLTLRFFEELEAQKAITGRNFWDGFCDLNSDAPGCKIYED